MLEKQDQLNTWLMEMAKGEISPEDQQRLEERMLSQPEVLAYCQDFFITSAGLEQIMRAEVPDAWALPVRRKRWLGWACGVAAALLIAFALWVAWSPQKGIPHALQTAQLIDSQGLKWSMGSEPVAGQVFHGSQALDIQEGVAKFKMGDGTQILVKGPCQLTLQDSNQVRLDTGMLTAHVPGEARGFEVLTAHARIVDLGTEFGVLTWPDGGLETQVFSGRVDVWPTGTNQALQLSTGQQALVDAQGGAESYNQSQTQAYYIQHMPHETPASPGKQLDLADIVGGGNGFGYGVLDQGIDPLNGEILPSPDHTTEHFQQSRFTPIPNHPYIDGVFLPDGDSGPVRISTAEDVFEDCPSTRGIYYDGIFNGAKLYAEHMPEKTFQGRLNGITYGTYDRPAINCHPNAGITFDLKAIRRDNPGTVIESFTSLCGMNDITPSMRESQVDFWVLVDGQLMAHHRCVPQESTNAILEVPLSENARFLTLTTTADKKVHYCWAFFAEPTLIFNSVR